MMIRRAMIVVALLGIGLGACTTDEVEQEGTNQPEEEEEQDVERQDLDAGDDVDDEEADTSGDAGDDGDVDEAEDVDGVEDIGEDVEDADAGGEDGDVGEAEDVGEDAEDADAGGEDGDVGEAEDVGEDANDEPALEGDSCETAIDVTDEAVLIGESTVEMNDHYDPVQGADNCPGTNFSDRERVYVVSPAETTTYEVVAEPEDSFDLMLYARHDCAVDACVAGTRFNGAGGAETIEFEVLGGESVYIFVDGEIGHAGEFDLMVSIEE